MEKQHFFQDVWDVTSLIPYGRITSYGAIANYLGTKMSARMVGWALASCSASETKVPAWRVVNRKGELTGAIHFATPTEMKELLEKEGIVIQNNTVQHFAELYWDPNKELI